MLCWNIRRSGTTNSCSIPVVGVWGGWFCRSFQLRRSPATAIRVRVFKAEPMKGRNRTLCSVHSCSCTDLRWNGRAPMNHRS